MDTDAIRQRIDQLQASAAALVEQLDDLAEQDLWWARKIEREEQALRAGGSRVARDVREMSLKRSHEQLTRLRADRASMQAEHDRVERDLGRAKAELDRAEFVARHQIPPGQDPLADAARVTDQRLREAEVVVTEEAAALPAGQERASTLVTQAARHYGPRTALVAALGLAAILTALMLRPGPASVAANPTRLVRAAPGRDIRPVVFIAIGPLRDLNSEQRVDAISELVPQFPANLTVSEIELILGPTTDQPRSRILGLIRLNIERDSLPAAGLPNLLGDTRPDPRLAMIQTLAPFVTGPMSPATLLAVLEDLTGDARLTAIQALAPHLGYAPDDAELERLLTSLTPPQQLRARALLAEHE